MTTTPARTDVRAPAHTTVPRVGVPVAVLLAAVVATLLRLRYLHAPLSPDEGGFLTVARQWGPGPSLYGHYWVDRPPLLIALFRVAALTGGTTSLRLLGCLATAVTVVATGLGVRRVAGRVAAGWAAAVAAALLVSPLVGAVDVNGELLAAPFVAVGAWLAVLAVTEARAARALLLAAGAGAAGAGAVLVKQNMLDVAVFAAVLVLTAWRTGVLDRHRVRTLVTGLGAGALTTSTLVLAGAWLAGTRPGPVLFAMYAFRMRAAAVMTTTSTTARLTHLHALGLHELVALGVLPVVTLAVLLWTRRRAVRRTPSQAVAVATLAVAAYDVVSVLLGGSYWSHYLVQLAVPTALAGGLVAGWRPRLGPLLVAPVLVSAVVAWSLGPGVRVHDPGERIGAALAEVSAPGDTMVTLLGDADMVETAGLPSPYPYLWSLPARTLDPRMTTLSRVLAGPDAPTWVVVRNARTEAALDRRPVSAQLDAGYHRVADDCGRLVLLRNGLQRPAPAVLGRCTTTLDGSADPLSPRSPR